MRIVCISDTHTLHNQISQQLPDGDILIHAGDFTGNGSIPDFKNFSLWLSSIEFKYKAIIVIAGNHDWLAERQPSLAKSIILENKNKVYYLNHQPLILNGLKIFGSPYTPKFYNWAFNVPRGPKLAALWKDIPNDTQILITHGPPMFKLDEVKRSKFNIENVGCQDLAERIKDLTDLKLHIFGHIHEGYGNIQEPSGLHYINASCLDERYKVANKPVCIDL